MSNLSEIISQLKANNASFLHKLEIIESDSGNVSEEVLRDLIQDARELHEGTVILSYLAYDKSSSNDEPVFEEEALPFAEAEKTTVSAGDFMTEEESTEEDELIDALDIAIQQTNQVVERQMEEPLIVNEINEVKNIIEEEESKVEEEEELPSQEEIISSLESDVSAVISSHTSDASLADQLNAEDNSLAARLAKKKIENLTSAIGINEKFLFTNELFDGNTEQFLKEINSLNNFSSMEEAQGYLNSLGNKNDWDLEGEPFLKLVALVERKYV